MEQRLQQPEILQQPEETLVPCNYEGSGIGKTQRWRQAWKQRLVVATLVISDLLLALSVWGWHRYFRANGVGGHCRW